MKPATMSARPARALKARRGVSLLFALLALVALSLAAIALVRSVDTGTVVLGNLGFKQEVTASTDQVTQQATTWLKLNGSALTATGAKDSGYYAAYVDDLDPTGRHSESSTRTLIDWDRDGCKSVPEGKCTIFPFDVKVTDPSKGLKGLEDKTAQYVIIRLCSAEGETDASGNVCMSASTVVTGAVDASSRQRGEINYTDNLRIGNETEETRSGSAYYRIIVRVVGVRNTASFTETIVHF